MPRSTAETLCHREAMTIHYAVEGAVAAVTIDRPERRNAVNQERARGAGGGLPASSTLMTG